MAPPAKEPAAASLDDCQWLTSPAAAPLLALAADRTRPLPALLDQLRKEVSPQRAHLLAQQAELRRRAADKFARAGAMFFLPAQLEQATDEIVAAYMARRFAGLGQVFDLCTGIGGDLLGLAARNVPQGGAATTVGVDRDAVLAHIAQQNLRVALDGREPQHAARVECGDVLAVDLAACDAWHIDPDRRPLGRRTTRVELHEPDAAALEAMLARNANAAIKLAPAASVPESWQSQFEWEWISRGGECRQLVAWGGGLARDLGLHRATVLAADGGFRTLTGEPDSSVPPAANIGRYLFEPDAAVLAAKLERVLAAEHGLSAIVPGVAYWTGEQPIVDAALACFEVDCVLPFRAANLKSLLHQRGIGRLEIKKRGVDIDPQQLRKELQLRGEKSATLVLFRHGKKIQAILAQRVTAVR